MQPQGRSAAAHRLRQSPCGRVRTFHSVTAMSLQKPTRAAKLTIVSHMKRALSVPVLYLTAHLRTPGHYGSICSRLPHRPQGVIGCLYLTSIRINVPTPPDPKADPTKKADAAKKESSLDPYVVIKCVVTSLQHIRK